MSRPAPARKAVAALTIMELRLALRRGENLLVMLVIPVAVLLFFGGTGIIPLASPGSAVDFLLPGSIALAIIATSLVNLGIATAYERSYGVLKRLGGSPLPRWGLVAAKIGAVLAIEVVQVVLLLGAAAAFLGWSPAEVGSGTAAMGGAAIGSVASVALLVAGVLLGTLAFAGLGLLMAGTLRAEATLALANALFLGFLMVGGIVLPLDHLPGPLAAIASVLPASALSDVLRVSLGGTADLGAALALLVAWGLGATVLASQSFRWE